MEAILKRLRHYTRATWAENIKSWKIDLSYRTDFIRGLLEPFFWLLPFVLYGMAIAGGRHSESLAKLVGNGDLITFTTLGYIFMAFLNTALWGMGYAFRQEQWFGTLESVFVAPIPRWVYLLGRASHSMMHQGLIILIQMVLIYFILGLVLDIRGILPALLSIGLMLIALYGLGVFISGMMLAFKRAMLVVELLDSLIIMLTPIAYPLSVLPLALQKLSITLPTTYGIMLLRHFLIGEEMGFSVGVVVFRLIIIGCIWVIFGLFVFNLIDRRVRRIGTLAEY